MEDLNIDFREVRYKEFRDGVKCVEKDTYGILEYALSEPRKTAFLSNPYITNENYIVLGIASVDGQIVGRNMSFPTRFKAGENILNCMGGSSLEVYKSFRNPSVSIPVITAPLCRGVSDAIIYSDFTEDGERTFRALRFCDFKLAKMIRPNNCRFLFEMIGARGLWVKLLSTPCNLVVKCMVFLQNVLLKRQFVGITVEEVKLVPFWVETIVRNDTHKYMEYHDRNWFQWNLDNMFHYHERNTNKFFILKKKSKDIGFFMIKERWGGIPSRGISPMLTGTVVEWGTKDPTLIDEFVIYMIATKYFSKDIDIINVYSDDANVIKRLKRHLFVHHKYHHIMYKDLTKKYKDAKDQKLWRLRFGYSDSVLN